MFVSSAKYIGKVVSDAFRKSLMKIKKSSGPLIGPWGTPYDIVAVSDLYLNYNVLLN